MDSNAGNQVKSCVEAHVWNSIVDLPIIHVGPFFSLQGFKELS